MSAVLAVLAGMTVVYPAAAAATIRQIYVANFGGTTVTAIDPGTNTVTATITVGNRPFGVAISPDGTRAYVTNFGGNSVTVINTLTNTVTTTITDPSFNFPQGATVTVSPIGARAYVTNFLGNSVSVINTLTNTVTTTIPVGVGPRDVAISPDGTRAYVVNLGNSVSVINTASNTVITTITNPGFNVPQGVTTANTPLGARAYLTNFNGNSVSVIDIRTNAVVTTITNPSFSSPAYLAATPNGTRVYVTNNSGNSVSIIDTVTDTVATTITDPSFRNPTGVAVAAIPEPRPAPKAEVLPITGNPGQILLTVALVVIGVGAVLLLISHHRPGTHVRPADGS